MEIVDIEPPSPSDIELSAYSDTIEAKTPRDSSGFDLEKFEE